MIKSLKLYNFDQTILENLSRSKSGLSGIKGKVTKMWTKKDEYLTVYNRLHDFFVQLHKQHCDFGAQLYHKYCDSGSQLCNQHADFGAQLWNEHVDFTAKHFKQTS